MGKFVKETLTKNNVYSLILLYKIYTYAIPGMNF